MELFAQISKVDEEKRLIFGRAVDEAPDRSGEVFDYTSSKPYFEAWSAETKEASDGKSVGNLRAMHGKVAAGRLVDMQFNDDSHSIDVVAHVVDNNEWEKVLTGCYTGFSIGGSYVKKWDDPAAKVDANKPALKRYTAAPNELSLVDRPCIPTARFFDVQKADGTVTQVEFVPAYTQEDVEAKARELCASEEMDPDAPALGKGDAPTWMMFVKKAESILEKRDFSAKQREKAADSGAAMPDGSFPIKNGEDLENAIKLAGNAKDPDAARAHIKARAKKLGLEDKIPDTWKADMTPEDPVAKQEAPAPEAPVAATEPVVAKAEEPAPQPVEYQVEGTDEEVSKLAKSMYDEKLAMKDVLAIVDAALAARKANAAAADEKATILKLEGEGKLKKGMYTVGRLAMVVQQLDDIRASVNDEEKAEGDGSPLPMQMLDLVGLASQVLKDMVMEEANELLINPDDANMGTQPEVPVPAMAVSSAPKVMQLSDHFGALRKIGARNSKNDTARIQHVHDLSVELGGVCSKESADTPAPPAKADAPNDLQKFVDTAVAAALEKIAAPLKEENKVLLQKIEKLESEPRAPKGVLRAFNKSHDTGAAEDPAVPVTPPVMKGGVPNEAATEIRKAHLSGGKPFLSAST